MTSILVGTKDGVANVEPNWTREPVDHRVDALIRRHDGWWALTNGSTIWFHPDDGDGAVVDSVRGVRLNCLLPLSDELLLGAAAAQMFRLGLDRSGGKVASTGVTVDGPFERAPGRDSWYTPWGGPPDVRSMDRDVDGTIYANVHVGGVLRFRDDDPVWRDTMDINADVHQVIAHPEMAGRALAATAWGLAITHDGAANWNFHTDGLHATYCRAVATSGDRAFVSVALGSRGQQAAVYRTDLTGKAMERCVDGLPEWFSTNIDTGCLAAEGDLVVIGDPEGSVYRSVDGGDKWDLAMEGLPGVTWTAIGP